MWPPAASRRFYGKRLSSADTRASIGFVLLRIVADNGFIHAARRAPPLPPAPVASMIRRIASRPLLRACALVLAVAASATAFAQSDADLLRAKDAFDRGDRRRLDALAPALEGHALATYVAFWRLRIDIDAADPGEVRRFLAREAGSPLADRLRVEWLKSLARRGLWSDFAADQAATPADDLEVNCYAWQRRLDVDAPSVRDAARAAWFTGQTTPDACEPVFAQLFARGMLSDADRRARMRLASEANNVRLAESLGTALPGHARITAREYRTVDRDPARALAKGQFAWKTSAGRDLALYAIERVARRDADAAHASFSRWRGHLTAEDRSYAARRIAYHAARQLDPAALEWYRESGAPAGSVDELAWRVRAALRVKAWADVDAAIDALPASERQDAAWRYWKARALTGTGRSADAQALYATLRDDTGFYGLLAAEARGLALPPIAAEKAEPYRADAAALATFGARADVQRMRKLLELDMRPEALREWAYIVRGQPDEFLLLAAEYARRAGLYDRAINAAERTASHHDIGLRYLAPWRSEFAAASREQGVDEALLYGIARQESRFVPDIVSSAGAVGLMQLMPATARWVARKLARTDFSPATIVSVPLNTQFGAFYFRFWHDRLGERPALTAAAYNAGPGRAQQWRPAAASLEGAIWVETIPFSETRDYVKKVLANSVLYARVLGLPHVSLTDRLGVVTPRGADNAAVAAGTP
jgi:soluble lytic murein transglycosylase